MAGYIGSKSSVTLVDGITKNGGTLEGDLSFGDNDKAIFGAGSDLQIYHDGTHSYVADAGGGSLVLSTNGSTVSINTDGPENMAIFRKDGSVDLFHNNSKKFETTSTGIDVTGTAVTDGITSSGNIEIAKDSPQILWNDTAGGTQVDYSAYANGGAFAITDVPNSYNLLTLNSGSVSLAYQSTVKLATTSTGATIRGDGDAILLLNTASDAGDKSLIRFGDNDDADAGYIDYDHGTNSLAFGVNASERMRIDSSGNLLVGKTATGISAAGHSYRADGTWEVRRDISSANSSTVGYLSRGTTDGNILTLYKDTTSVGSIGVSGGKMSITGTNNNLQIGAAGSNILNVSTASVYPDTDNSVDLGLSNRRFDDIFATNGTIQTSDFNEKQDIASLKATEMLVGKRISELFKTFRWKDSVAENGDSARTHTGIIAQDVQAAFTAEGLDAGDYALFISSTWWETQTEVPAVEAVAEVTDEDGNVTTEAVEAKDAYTRTDTYETEAEAPEGATSKTRLGIRYPELLSFVAAYNEQRFASIEARLTALEA